MTVGKRVQIDLVAASTVITAAQLVPIAAALQRQAREHVAQHYGTDPAMLIRVVSKPTPGHWYLWVLDDSDTAGALGYHTTTDGLPTGKVFAKTDQHYGLSVSVTLSHEVCEMVGDPHASLCYQRDPSVFGAYELCDPCEADALGYTIDGVLVSDFVLPAWFDGGPGPYTYNNTIGAPGALAPGGYISLWSQSTGWTQQTAQTPGVTSRSVTMSRHFERALASYVSALVPVVPAS